MRAVPLLALLFACAPEAPTALFDPGGRIAPLLCPGSQGCADTRGHLSVGVAKRDITPRIETWSDVDQDGSRSDDEPFVDLDGDSTFDPVYMAGFGLNRLALSVHDPLWARAIVLERGGLKIALVAMDLIGVFQREVLRIRERVRAADPSVDQVIVVATHQHEGPDTMGLWGPSFLSSGSDPDYLEHIVQMATEAALEASEQAVPSALRVAIADASDLIVDTRLPIVVDGQVTVIEARADGKTILEWVIYGNHPETLWEHNRSITSDYPGALREALEAARPGALAVFTPGGLGGMMSPLELAGCPDGKGMPTCEKGQFALAEYVGRTVAERALSALSSSAAADLGDADLALTRRNFLLPTDNESLAVALSAGIFQRRFFGAEGLVSEAEPPPLAAMMAGEVQLEAEVNRLRIGTLDILLAPGETYPELWLERDGHSLAEAPPSADYQDAPILPALSSYLDGAHKVLMNQANDTLGYIIPKSQFDLLPPHAYRENGQYGEANSVGPETAPRLIEATRQLVSTRAGAPQ